MHYSIVAQVTPGQGLQYIVMLITCGVQLAESAKTLFCCHAGCSWSGTAVHCYDEGVGFSTVARIWAALVMAYLYWITVMGHLWAPRVDQYNSSMATDGLVNRKSSGCCTFSEPCAANKLFAAHMYCCGIAGLKGVQLEIACVFLLGYCHRVF